MTRVAQIEARVQEPWFLSGQPCVTCATFITHAREDVPYLLDALAAKDEALREAADIAAHLHQMIDVETWRACGGDDGQGHYAGDYHAEKLQARIEELAALAVPATKEPTRAAGAWNMDGSPEWEPDDVVAVPATEEEA